MTKSPAFSGFLLMIALAAITARGADSLFAPEPAPAASSSQVSQPSLAADTAAMAEAAAAVSSVPPISANPDPSALLVQNPPTVPQPGSPSATAPAPTAADTPTVTTKTSSAVASDTNAPASVNAKDTKGQQPEVTRTVAPSIKPMPVDQPPNLDQPADKMAATAPPAPPSENVTLNLINRLVQRGILTKDDAGDLIRQAKEDAKSAAQQSQMTQQAAQQASAAQQMAVEAAAPPSSDDSVSVSYVPEIVKSEMRDEIKRDVIAAAQSEGWATPNYPSWINNFRPFMDLRTRYELDTFSGNDMMSNSFQNLDTINFNSINTGSPMNMSQIPGAYPQGQYYSAYPGLYPSGIFPIAQSQNASLGLPTGQQYYYPQQTPGQTPPTYNTTQQRERLRIRFRFGADMNLGENFTSGFRIGTGQNGSPVSGNQTLGAPTTYGNPSQGGNFSSYAIWLDRAFLKYEIGDNPDKMAAVTVGRFDNPFYTPTTIMWANDIGFDGVAAQARYKIFKGFTPFATIGLFPIYNTDLNYASRVQPKYASYDKYLYAAQGGIDWKINKDFSFKGSVGYYYFQNAQGQVSSPMVTPNDQAQGSTDNSRPSFAQNGNTYIELRNIKKVNAYPTNSDPLVPAYVTNNANANYVDNPDYAAGNAIPPAPGLTPLPAYQNQFQYFGLATPYNILSANAKLEYRHFEPFVVSVSGEWDQNVAFNRQNVLNNGPTPGPDNNYNETLIQGPVNNIGTSGYNGGNNAWIMQAKVGSGALQKRWDWDFGLSYRYVESDAIIDGFCDSDFGGGGTNLKGWAIGGNLALSKNVFIGARWFNANSIAGPTLNSNILQVDLNARF